MLYTKDHNMSYIEIRIVQGLKQAEKIEKVTKNHEDFINHISKICYQCLGYLDALVERGHIDRFQYNSLNDKLELFLLYIP